MESRALRLWVEVRIYKVNPGGQQQSGPAGRKRYSQINTNRLRGHINLCDAETSVAKTFP